MKTPESPPPALKTMWGPKQFRFITGQGAQITEGMVGGHACCLQGNRMVQSQVSTPEWPVLCRRQSAATQARSGQVNKDKLKWVYCTWTNLTHEGGGCSDYSLIGIHVKILHSDNMASVSFCVWKTFRPVVTCNFCLFSYATSSWQHDNCCQ